MTAIHAGSDQLTLLPTRRLTAKERAVFDRVSSQFAHLTASDAEQLTQYAESSVRYEAAVRETKKHPTVSQPVINRTTGNVVGEKPVRNPAFATLREAQAQMVSLGRRLLIDAHSADKRQKLLTRKSRSLTAAEQDTPALTEARMAAYAAEAYTDPEDACLFLQPGERLDERGMII